MTHSELEPFLIVFIETLIEQGKKQFALSLTFEATLYTDGEILEAPYRTAHLLVDARTNYKGIWACITPGFKTLQEVKDEEWEFHSYHDSCWRDDGLHWAFQLWLEMRDELGKLAKEAKVPADTAQLSRRTTAKPMMAFFHEVTFEKEQDPTPNKRGYVVKGFAVKPTAKVTPKEVGNTQVLETGLSSEENILLVVEQALKTNSKSITITPEYRNEKVCGGKVEIHG